MQTSLPVIVVGSGIAGLNFALSAAEFSDVLIITKKKMVESATNYAQGGIAAVIDRADDVTQHIADTLAAGAGHNDKRAVRYMVTHGPSAIRRLIEFGVHFHMSDGKLELRREGGHGRRRIAHVGDYTGKEIEHALARHARAHPRITIWEDTFAIDLLVAGRGVTKRCYGVSVMRKGRAQNVFGRAVILATGGLGQIFKYTTNPPFSTGDGYAMAYRAGCAFLDMEFIQFHPTALNLGRGKRLFLISEALRGEGARLLNSRGKRFVKELEPRDIVARACYQEEKRGPIYIDLRHLDQNMLEVRFPQIYFELIRRGLHPSRDLIPVTPAAHYCCGGVKVNLKGETGIRGLYAFGEVAGTGVHGANRLASNSLLEAVVFSSRVADLLRRKRLEGRIPDFPVPKFSRDFFRSTANSRQLKKKLRSMMWDSCGIVRQRDELSLTRDFLFTLESDNFELRNMIVTSRLVVEAALHRKKSLGTHFMA